MWFEDSLKQRWTKRADPPRACLAAARQARSCPQLEAAVPVSNSLTTFHLHILCFRLGFHTWKGPFNWDVMPGEGPFQQGKPPEQGWEGKALLLHWFKPGLGYNSC